MTEVEHIQSRPRLERWLSRRIPGWACLVAWGAATAIFFGLVALLGGPASNDTYESVYATWAIQHGQLSCAFPSGFSVVPPVYPLVTGALAALLHVGQGVPFPSLGSPSAHCLHSYLLMDSWSRAVGAIGATVKIGYMSWLVLLAGVISVIRAIGLGRTRWEPAVAVSIAVLPPVWMSLATTFHPEYLMAVGLLLAAIACVLRDSWLAAGVFMALAVLTQQFALLVAIPLFVLAPSKRRLTYAGAGLVSALLIAAPLLVLSSGEAARTIAIGTGYSTGSGGTPTILGELHLTGLGLFVVSRIAAVLLSALVAVLAVRRFGRATLDPSVLLSIVAISLGLRLALEQRLFAYYFMAFAVALILLEAGTRRVRGWLIVWLGMLSLIYLAGAPSQNSLQYGPLNVLQEWFPVAVMSIVLAVGIAFFLEGRLQSRITAWVALLVVTLAAWRVSDPYHHQPPMWVWQLVLVSIGLVLAAEPLRRHPTTSTTRVESAGSLWSSMGSEEGDTFEKADVPERVESHLNASSPDVNPRDTVRFLTD